MLTHFPVSIDADVRPVVVQNLTTLHGNLHLKRDVVSGTGLSVCCELLRKQHESNVLCVKRGNRLAQLVGSSPCSLIVGDTRTSKIPASRSSTTNGRECERTLRLNITNPHTSHLNGVCRVIILGSDAYLSKRMLEIDIHTISTVVSQITLGIGIHEILLLSSRGTRREVNKLLRRTSNLVSTRSISSPRNLRSIGIEMQITFYRPEELTSIRSPGTALIRIKHLIHVVGL